MHARRVAGQNGPEDSPLAEEAGVAAEAARLQLEEMDLSGALETAWVFVRRLNRYVEEQAPWKLAKEAGGEGPQGRASHAALDATLWDLAEGLRLLSVLLHPFIPQAAGAIRERIGLTSTSGIGGPGWADARWGLLPAGLTVVTGAPLFPRIEDDEPVSK